jgi:hypothetical protein
MDLVIRGLREMGTGVVFPCSPGFVCSGFAPSFTVSA